MKIKNVTFIKSSISFKKTSTNLLPQYVFLGRSNVGKSSLINALTFKKKIAKTSSTPGKTRLVNYYLVNSNFFLIDLPGYGYVKTSKLHQNRNKKIIINYLLFYKKFINVFILIDSRHFFMKIDLNFINFMIKNKIQFSIVFTKYDKIQNKNFIKNFNLKNFFIVNPNFFFTSSVTKFGCKEILNYINNNNNKL